MSNPTSQATVLTSAQASQLLQRLRTLNQEGGAQAAGGSASGGQQTQQAIKIQVRVEAQFKATLPN